MFKCDPLELDFEQEFVERTASFGDEKYGSRGTIFFKQESDIVGARPKKKVLMTS